MNRSSLLLAAVADLPVTRRQREGPSRGRKRTEKANPIVRYFLSVALEEEPPP